jgi:hypothetical protein
MGESVQDWLLRGTVVVESLGANYRTVGGLRATRTFWMLERNFTRLQGSLPISLFRVRTYLVLEQCDAVVKSWTRDLIWRAVELHKVAA